MPKPPTKQKPKKVTRKAKPTKAAKAKPAAKKAAKPTKAAKPMKAAKPAKKPAKAAKPVKAAKPAKPAAKPTKAAKPAKVARPAKIAELAKSASAMGPYRTLLLERFAKLHSRDAQFAGGNFEINEPLTDDSLQVLSILGAREPDGVVRALYDQLDGVVAHWTLPDGASGGLSIPSATIAYLRAGLDEDSQPLEGVLWTDDDEPEVREQLQRMYILDSVPGRSDFLTYVPDEDRVYYVQRGEIQVLQTSLAETIDLLLRYLGSDTLRPHLVHTDWRERIAADPTLTWLDAS